ncbi:MAG TPA: SPFH domain-containing protein [Verrucomicrobiota bacterium]|nr:SPFH domain-containing protein [Verrucomicrobiota bacterium]
MLLVSLAASAGGIFLFVRGLVIMTAGGHWMTFIAGILLSLVAAISWGGFFTLQPNEARVLILFGAYRGTARRSGWHWTNPFNRKVRLSVRVRNLNSEKLKVNDKRGNPIEIGAVVVWRVAETAQAVFDVDSFEN